MKIMILFSDHPYWEFLHVKFLVKILIWRWRRQNTVWAHIKTNITNSNNVNRSENGDSQGTKGKSLLVHYCRQTPTVHRFLQYAAVWRLLELSAYKLQYSYHIVGRKLYRTSSNLAWHENSNLFEQRGIVVVNDFPHQIPPYLQYYNRNSTELM